MVVPIRLALLVEARYYEWFDYEWADWIDCYGTILVLGCLRALHIGWCEEPRFEFRKRDWQHPHGTEIPTLAAINLFCTDSIDAKIRLLT